MHRQREPPQVLERDSRCVVASDIVTDEQKSRVMVWTLGFGARSECICDTVEMDVYEIPVSRTNKLIRALVCDPKRSKVGFGESRMSRFRNLRKRSREKAARRSKRSSLCLG
jgi:hypothetical protein